MSYSLDDFKRQKLCTDVDLLNLFETYTSLMSDAQMQIDIAQHLLEENPILERFIAGIKANDWQVVYRAAKSDLSDQN